MKTTVEKCPVFDSGGDLSFGRKRFWTMQPDPAKKKSEWSVLQKIPLEKSHVVWRLALSIFILIQSVIGVVYTLQGND